jgi:hypothetical protein
MATKKKKKAKKPQAQNAQNMSPVQYFLSGRARTLELAECLINSDWKESGISSVVVARRHKTGNITFGTFLVDTYCLGLKNAGQGFNKFEDDYEDYKEQIGLSHQNGMMIIDYDLAHNIIYGAIQYAAKLGFEPHKDWKYGQMILQSLNAVPKIDIEFGKDGKPVYISGPYDKVPQIVEKLKKSVGEGNFEVIINVNSLGSDSGFGLNDLDFDDDDDFEDDDDEENDTQDVDYEEVKS